MNRPFLPVQLPRMGDRGRLRIVNGAENEQEEVCDTFSERLVEHENWPNTSGRKRPFHLHRQRYRRRCATAFKPLLETREGTGGFWSAGARRQRPQHLTNPR